MIMTVHRQDPIGQAILGEMTIGGIHAAYTLERVGFSIPAGYYQVSLYNSPHFQRYMPILLGVPGRDDILIHWGNFPQNSLGCILVGETQDASTGDIGNTVKQFSILFPKIESAVNAEGCWIAVWDVGVVSNNAVQVQQAATGDN
jgi:hypothetical protein